MIGRNFYLLSLVVLALAAPSFAQTTVCVPQFVDGTSGSIRWQSTLILMNQEQTQAQVQLQFRDNNGAPLQQLRMTRAHGQGPVQGVDTNGHFSPDPIRARSMAALQSSARVHEAVLSELRDQLAHRREILLADLPGSVSEVYVNR